VEEWNCVKERRKICSSIFSKFNMGELYEYQLSRKEKNKQGKRKLIHNYLNVFKIILN